MTSPARRTVTVSPTRTCFFRISNKFFKVALFTPPRGYAPAAPPHGHGAAPAPFFFADLERVVQGGVAPRAPADEYRREPGHGGEFAGAADLQFYAFDARGHLLRRVFVRHGPAR